MEICLPEAFLCVLAISQLGNRESSTDVGHKDLNPKTLTCRPSRGQLHFKWPTLVPVKPRWAAVSCGDRQCRGSHPRDPEAVGVD